MHRFIGVAPTSVRAAKTFARATGVHPALVELYTGFRDAFPQLGASRVVAMGSEPFIQWNPRGVPLKQIYKGKYDGYVRRYAAKVKGFSHRIILSFGHEMNGHWSLWSPPHATAWQFVHAWRRIHGIFQHSHVRNVTWSWDPSHTGANASPWWPGSKYVDRVGIDGYFRHGQTFKEIFGWQLGIIRRITSKPVFIGETSVAKGPGQARQVAGLFHGLRRYHLAGFVWFDINRLRVWRLEGRPWAIRAFRKCTHKSQRCP
jgi:Glycosyl hydrolase family 26